MDYNHLSNKTNGQDMHQKILSEKIDNLKVFDSEFCWKHRIDVLNELQQIALKIGGTIHILYPLRINAHFPGFDIDAVCVVTRNMHESFLEQQFPVELIKCSKFKEFRIIESIYVPIIEITFDGIQVRLSFAKLKLDEIPENISLIGMNIDSDVRSFLGEEDFIRMPEITGANIEVYGLVLRSVKLWAKQRGIYLPSNQSFLYTSWASMVAGSFYPWCADFTIIQRVSYVFSIFIKLKWPTASKMRKPVLDAKSYIYSPYIYCKDSSVPEITKRFVLHECKRAARLINEISRGRTTWDTFFHEPNFFYEHINFLVLMEWSPSEEAHLKWRNLIASKIHHLVDNLDNNKRLELSHVNPNHFKRPKLASIDAKPFCSMWFIAIEKKSEMAGYAQLIRKDIQDFEKELFRDPSAGDILNDGIEIEIRRITRNRLRFYLNKDYLAYIRKKLESTLPWSSETLVSNTEFDVDERLYIFNQHHTSLP